MKLSPKLPLGLWFSSLQCAPSAPQRRSLSRRSNVVPAPAVLTCEAATSPPASKRHAATPAIRLFMIPPYLAAWAASTLQVVKPTDTPDPRTGAVQRL